MTAQVSTNTKPARQRAPAHAGLLLALLGACGYAHAQQPPPSEFIEAQRAEAHGEFARAEGLYDQAISADPANTQAMFGRARMRSCATASHRQPSP